MKTEPLLLNAQDELRIRHTLKTATRGKVGHIAESLARSCGYSSHAARLSSMKLGDYPVSFDSQVFVSRMRSFGYEIASDFDLSKYIPKDLK